MILSIQTHKDKGQCRLFIFLFALNIRNESVKPLILQLSRHVQKRHIVTFEYVCSHVKFNTAFERKNTSKWTDRGQLILFIYSAQCWHNVISMKYHFRIEVCLLNDVLIRGMTEVSHWGPYPFCPGTKLMRILGHKFRSYVNQANWKERNKGRRERWKIIKKSFLNFISIKHVDF